MLGNKYNTALAVRAYRMMYFETHLTADCCRLVWQQIDNCLQALAADPPSYLTCLHSRAYTESENQDPRQIDIHVVGLDRQLLLLGTASTRQAAIADWWDRIYFLNEMFGSPPAALAWSGAGVLRRDFCGSIIPVEDDELTGEVLDAAAHRALSRIGSLAQIPIHWLDDDTSLTLYSQLYQEAERTARPLTERQRRLVIKHEYEES